VIREAGYGEAFVHRTGHSIGQETHGNGANMDNLETHDERRVLRRTCFSIEPGIYLDEFGVRSEVNVFVDGDGAVHVTGEPQTEVLPILRDFAPRAESRKKAAAPKAVRGPSTAGTRRARKTASGAASRAGARPKAARPARSAKKKAKPAAARPQRSGKRQSGRRRS
jgi:hypothetical protein